MFHKVRTDKKYSGIYAVAVFLLATVYTGILSHASAEVAQTPPMGWNSYDAFCYAVKEDEVKANAQLMVDSLLQFGWEYVVVDYVWWIPRGEQGWPPSINQTTYNMDDNGRWWPDEERFPSSKDGNGFKPLADWVHSKGLKLGIHLMASVPRPAVNQELPIKNSDYTCGDIAKKDWTCIWNDYMYHVDMTKPGAQDYLNSCLDLYAEWEIDYLKIDDLSASFQDPPVPAYYTAEVEGWRQAIDQCGREMVFSTSPGPTPLTEADHISQHANMWRTWNDLWDTWNAINTMIQYCNDWIQMDVTGPGHWPDPDMLPLGHLDIWGEHGVPAPRYTKLTTDEQYLVMSLWSITKAPLMYGGNLPDMRPEDWPLIMNAEILHVNQHGVNARCLLNDQSQAVWAADDPNNDDTKYFAFFNRSSSAKSISTDVSNLVSKPSSIWDVWEKELVKEDHTGEYSVTVPSHGSKFYRLNEEPIIEAHPSLNKSIQPALLHENFFKVTGDRFMLPSFFTGKTVTVDIFDCAGRRIHSLRTSSGAVELKKELNISRAVHIVRVRKTN